MNHDDPAESSPPILLQRLSASQSNVTTGCHYRLVRQCLNCNPLLGKPAVRPTRRSHFVQLTGTNPLYAMQRRSSFDFVNDIILAIK